MRKLIPALLASAAIVCSLSSTAFAKDPPPNALARGYANKGVFGVTHDPMTNDGRMSGSVPKMYSGLGALPFYKGLGNTASPGSSVTRIGFRFAGREKETFPVKAGGKVVGQETHVVTRFFNRGSETRTVQTHQVSSQSEYKFRQSPFGGGKSWDATSKSTERLSNNRTVRTVAAASGGDSPRVGRHVTGNAMSTITEGNGKKAVVIGQGNASVRRGWSTN